MKKYLAVILPMEHKECINHIICGSYDHISKAEWESIKRIIHVRWIPFLATCNSKNTEVGTAFGVAGLVHELAVQ